MAADEYIPCLKCDVWVPYYAKEIHMAECHELALKLFSHPFITGSSLFGQVTITGKSEPDAQETKEKDSLLLKSSLRSKKNTSKNESKGENLSASRINNESLVAEPEWLKKILPSLHYRVVLMNERDLIRCDITAYTPVELRVGDTAWGFLAMPEEGVCIGHLMLHQGSTGYIPELKDHGLVCVKKIDCVSYVDEITVSSNKTFTSDESSYYENQVQALLYSSNPLGAPFTLNAGGKIHLPSLNKNDTTFTVQSYKLSKPLNDDRTSYESTKEDQDSTTNPSDTSDSIPSQLITVDECDCSMSSVIEKVTKLQITTPLPSHIHLEETINTTNPEASIWTSTPKRGSSEGGEYNTTFPSKINSKEISTISGLTTETESFPLPEKITPWARTGKEKGGECNTTFPSKINSKEISTISGLTTETESFPLPEKITPWVRTGRDTRVILQPMTAGKADVVSPKAVVKDDYCKDQVYYSLKNIMEAALTGSGITDSPLLGRWSGVLLYGPPGTGKTCMVQEVVKELNVPVFTLTLSSVSKSSGSAKEHVQSVFGAACQSAPSVLFIDEVDSLCTATDLKTQADKTLTPHVLQGIQTLQSASRPVFLIAATSQPARVAPKLRSPGRLEREIMVPLPDAQQRGRIFQQLMSTHRHDLTEDDINSVAKKAYGFSGADLSVLIRCAWLACTKRTKVKEDLKLSRDDVYAGLQSIVPTMLRHNYSAVSMVKWHDIWGYQSIKMRLQKNIELYTCNPEKHSLKGLLLYGPPGCSKTMFVRALVHETSYSFFPLKCSNLLSKYVGETEKLLSQVFVRAQQAAPSVVFMDEVDSLCGERTGGGSLVSELLSLMAQTAVQRNIMVIGATNRPHGVDEALLRPGYLEQVIHVDLPDYETRCAMWRGVLEGIPQEGPIDIARLSEATAGYSGAEITGVYQETSFTALEKYIDDCDDQKPRHEMSPCPISLNEDQLMTTIAALPPRTPPSLLEAIASFTRQRKDSLVS